MIKEKRHIDQQAERRMNDRVYQKPRLICYGDVRDVTLGGSPGGGDSGSPTVERRR
ncbi:MAG: lasso RiPP family leader peptide-containing protein [Arenicella sp.]